MTEAALERRIRSLEDHEGQRTEGVDAIAAGPLLTANLREEERDSRVLDAHP
ncbi:MAG: hypothetical protein L0I76_11420 [Pseudonocardia sp.]|nr:hypothetical protein [Pseudonocardia sp.]